MPSKSSAFQALSSSSNDAVEEKVMHAARNDLVDTLEKLLATEDGRLVDACDAATGEPAICAAAANGNARAVEALLDARADATRGSPAFAETALHLAAREGHNAVIKALLKSKLGSMASDLADLKNYHGATALHLASERGHAEAVAMIAQATRKSQLDIPDMSGRTPLQLACFWGHEAVAEALLTAGADPDAEHPGSESARALCDKRGGAALRQVILQHDVKRAEAAVHEAEAARRQEARARAAAEAATAAVKTELLEEASVRRKADVRLKEARAAAQAANNARGNAERRLTEERSAGNALRTELSNLKKDLAMLTEECTDLRKALNTATQDGDESAAQAEAQAVSARTSRAEVERLTSRISELEGRNAETEAELARAKESLAMHAASQSARDEQARLNVERALQERNESAKEVLMWKAEAMRLETRNAEVQTLLEEWRKTEESSIQRRRALAEQEEADRLALLGRLNAVAVNESNVGDM
ncbi:hypothetical protein NFJ02_02g70340 [Pycnococcus provasolii]